MPPINPSLIPQSGQPRTLAGAPPVMPSVIPNGTPILPTNSVQTGITAAEGPAAIREKNANATLSEARAANEAAIPWDDKTVEFVAQGLAAGTPITQLTGGFGMGSAGRANQTRALTRLQEIQGSKGLTGEDQARQIAHFAAGRQAMTTLEKQYGTIQANEATTRGNIQNYLNLSQDLPLQTGSPAVNSAIQLAQKYIPGLPGHDEVPEMQAAGTTGLNEYARLMSNAPSGAGVLTDAARHEAREIMTGNYAPSQKQAVWQLMQADMDNRIKGVRGALDQGYVNLTKVPGYQVPADALAAGHGIAPTPQEVLDNNYKLIHGIYTNASTGLPSDETKISTTEKSLPPPPGYSAENTAYLTQNKGKLTPEDYTAFRYAQDKKYGREGGQYDPVEIKKFVDAVNSGAIPTAVPATNIPLSSAEKVGATVASHPIGTFAENAGNAAALGLPELALGQDTRDKFHMGNQENWKSALGGDVAGSILPTMAVGKGLGALAVKLGVTPEVLANVLRGAGRAKALGNIGTNAAYGATRGFNAADNGDHLEGALGGAAAGAVGGAIGEGATKGAVPLLGGTTVDALRQMKGIDLTTLQRLGLGEAEGTLSGVPGVHGATQKALDSFNVVRANKALAPIGQTLPDSITSPQARNAFVHDAANAAYEKVKPEINGSLDKPFQDQTTILKAMADTKEKQGMFRDIQAATNLAFDKDGHFDGNGYLAASQRLQAVQQALADQGENQGSLAARDMSMVAGKARDQLKALVARQVPKQVANDLHNVEKAWGMKMQLEDATNRALASNGGIYSPSQAITTAKKFDNSVNTGASARGQALGMEPLPGKQPRVTNFLEAAQNIMGSGTVPAKASLRAAEAAGVLGGVTGYASHGAVPAIAGTVGVAAYAPLIKRITQTALARPSAIAGTKTIVNNEATRIAIADAMRKMMSGGK